MEPNQFADPYSVVRRLRASGEISKSVFRVEAGFAQAASYRDVEEWTALSYNAARAILVDHRNFSSRAYGSTHDRKMGAATILSMDEPEHRTHRDLIAIGFFAKNVKEWAARLVPVVLERLVRDVVARQGSTVDLVANFTSIFPIQVIVAVVGVPDTDWPQFLKWVDALVDISNNPERALAAGAEVQRYLTQLVAERRRDPRDDLASTLVAAEIQGERLSDPSIVAFLALLLTAGGETTVRAIGTTLLGLLEDEAQLAAVRADRSLIPVALEEGLRWDTPVQLIRRVATQDIVVADTTIPKGTHVSVHIGAANRDPMRWTDADRYDVRRKQLPHISFGTGVHVCLGMNLARYEAHAALTMLLDRLPGLRLASRGRKPVIRGVELRGPDSLEVEFDAA